MASMWTGLAGEVLLLVKSHDGDNILHECCVLVQMLLHTRDRRLVTASLMVDLTLHCCMLALCSPKLQQVKLVGVTGS